MPKQYRLLSDCCSAPILGEVSGEGPDAVAVCSQCKEWAGVYDENEEDTNAA